MIAIGIAGAEVAFWLVLVSGLALRYVLRRARLSTVVLTLLPVLDLALLGVVVIDLVRGTTPNGTHALAGTYLGFTLAFGPTAIGWADSRFACHFRGKDLPVKPGKGTTAYRRSLWTEWFRVLLAAAIAAPILLIMRLLAEPSTAQRAHWEGDPFLAQLATLGLITGIWFLAGPAFTRVTKQ